MNNITQGKGTILLDLNNTSIKTYNLLCDTFKIYQENMAHSVSLSRKVEELRNQRDDLTKTTFNCQQNVLQQQESLEKMGSLIESVTNNDKREKLINDHNTMQIHINKLIVIHGKEVKKQETLSNTLYDTEEELRLHLKDIKDHEYILTNQLNTLKVLFTQFKSSNVHIDVESDPNNNNNTLSTRLVDSTQSIPHNDNNNTILPSLQQQIDNIQNTHKNAFSNNNNAFSTLFQQRTVGNTQNILNNNAHLFGKLQSTVNDNTHFIDKPQGSIDNVNNANNTFYSDKANTLDNTQSNKKEYNISPSLQQLILNDIKDTYSTDNGKSKGRVIPISKSRIIKNSKQGHKNPNVEEMAQMRPNKVENMNTLDSEIEIVRKDSNKESIINTNTTKEEMGNKHVIKQEKISGNLNVDIMDKSAGAVLHTVQKVENKGKHSNLIDKLPNIVYKEDITTKRSDDTLQIVNKVENKNTQTTKTLTRNKHSINKPKSNVEEDTVNAQHIMNEFRNFIDNKPSHSNITANDNIEVIAHKEDIVDHTINVDKHTKNVPHIAHNVDNTRNTIHNVENKDKHRDNMSIVTYNAENTPSNINKVHSSSTVDNNATVIRGNNMNNQPVTHTSKNIPMVNPLANMFQHQSSKISIPKSPSITIPTSSLNTMSSQITGNTHSESVVPDNNATILGNKQSSNIDNIIPD